MATVLALPRSLPAVLLDMTTTRQRLVALEARTMGRDMDVEEDRLFSDLDQRFLAGQAEAKSLILSSTGVSWDEIYQVLA